MIQAHRKLPPPNITPPVSTGWIPDRTAARPELRYRGPRGRYPEDFDCEVSMPHIDSLDTLPTVLALLRAQSLRPFIQIIDTGSTPVNAEKLEQMRADDLEIHFLRFNSSRHISDLPAVACDLAFSSSRHEKTVLMHTDVFLRTQTALEDLLGRCDALSPAVGFQMTPRDHPGWEKVVTHSLACFHMPTMDRIGAGWSLRRACRRMQCEHSMRSRVGNLLDTELGLSLILEEHGIAPTFIGTEQNWEMTVHPLMRHCRTLSGSRLFDPIHARKAEQWLQEALQEARGNLRAWKEPNP